MVVLQSGLSEDDFTQMTVLLGAAVDPQSCATDLAAALQTAHVSASAGDDCGDMLQDAVDVLAPYVACPGRRRRPVWRAADDRLRRRFGRWHPRGSDAAAERPSERQYRPTLTFNWVAPFNGPPQSYSLYYKPSSSNGAPLSTSITGSLTGYQLTGLTAATTYSVYMTSCAGGTCSAFSNTETGTTATPVTVAPPVVPTNVHATSVGQNMFTVNWTFAGAQGRPLTCSRAPAIRRRGRR